jgi:hypothetical protein
MIKVVLSSAAAFVVVTVMSSAAFADMNPGPVQNGKMCWKDTVARKGEFGFWAACPAPASVATAPKQTRRARG